MSHITNRTENNKEHGGVFIGINLHGTEQIGVIVNFVTLYHEAIVAGAATIMDDVYNQVIYFS